MESPLNKKIQRSLERTAAKKKKDSNYIPVLTLRQQVLSLVTEANKSAQPERRVTPRSALIVMNRALANLAVVDEESRDFAVLREVSSFISTAQKTSVMTASAHTDLLPQGHPLSALNASLTPEEYRFKYAQWLAADADVSSAARPLVAAAFSAKPGSIERNHAFMRLSVTTEKVPGYFKLDPAPIIAAFSDGNSSAARRARVALQWRDKRGRWVEMGRGANFRYRTSSGSVASASGVYVGVATPRPGENRSPSGLIQVSGDANLPDGIYAAQPSNVETYSARIPTEALKKAGITPGATPSQSMVGVPTQDEILATRRDAPEGWTKQDDNTFTSDDNYTAKVTDGEYTLFRQNEDGSMGDKVGDAGNWAEINELANNDQDAYDEVKGQASSPEAREQVKARIATRTKYNEEFDRLEELVNSGVDQNGNQVPAGWEGTIKRGAMPEVERRAIGGDRVFGEEGLPYVEYNKTYADDNGNPVVANAMFMRDGKFYANNKEYDSWDAAEADIPNWIAAEEDKRGRKLEPIAALPFAPSERPDDRAGFFDKDGNRLPGPLEEEIKLPKFEDGPSDYVRFGPEPDDADYRAGFFDKDGNRLPGAPASDDPLPALTDEQKKKIDAEIRDLIENPPAPTEMDKRVEKLLKEQREEWDKANKENYARIQGEVGDFSSPEDLPTEGVIEGTDIRYEIKTGPGQLGGRMRDGRIRNRERAAVEGQIAGLYLTGDTSGLKLPELERNGIWRGLEGGDRSVFFERPTAPHPMAGDPVEDAKKIVAQLNEQNRARGAGTPPSGPGEPPSGKTVEQVSAELDKIFADVPKVDYNVWAEAQNKSGDNSLKYPTLPEGALLLTSGEYNNIVKYPDGTYAVGMGEGAEDPKNPGMQVFTPLSELDSSPDYTIYDANGNEISATLPEVVLWSVGPNANPDFGGVADFIVTRKDIPFNYDAAKKIALDPSKSAQERYAAIFDAASGRDFFEYVADSGVERSELDPSIPEGAEVVFADGDGQNLTLRYPDGTYHYLDTGLSDENGLIPVDPVSAYDAEGVNNAVLNDLLDINSLAYARGSFMDSAHQDLIAKGSSGDSGDEPPAPPSGDGENTPGGGFADYVIDLAEDNRDLGRDLEEKLDDDAEEAGVDLMDQIYEDASDRYELAQDIADNKPDDMSNEQFIDDAVAKMREQLSDIVDAAIQERRDLEDDEDLEVDFDKEAFVEAGAARFRELLQEEIDGIEPSDGDDEPPAPPSGPGGTPPKTPSPSTPSSPGLFSEFDVPNGAFELRGVDYEPEGRVDERSTDFTDDPEKLATKFSVEDLIAAFSEAILGNSSDASVAEILNANVGDDDELGAPSEVDVNVNMPQVALGSPSGAGRLEFNAGEEFVLAESLFNALWHAGVDPNRVLANLYDSVNGDNKNLSKLIEAQGGTPSAEEAQLVDDITAEIRQIKDATPDGEPSIANQKNEPSEELTGSLIENIAIDFENPDYYIPDPSAYVPSQEEPDENGYTDNPRILGTDYNEADLIMQMLEGITDGSGAALLNFGDIITEVPVEAIRDALQLQGINTNDILVDLKRESNDMSEPEPEPAPVNPRLQAHSQKIKDLIEQTGNTIDDDTADKIRDAIDDDWGVNWSEATDEEIIEAIIEVAGPGVFGREIQEDATPEVEDTPVDSADLPRDPSVDVPVDSPEFEAPRYNYPGPREAGYTTNNVVLDSNGAAVGAGARVQALSDGRAGTVLAVQNIDTKSGRDADYVRIRFDDGSTAVRSARQIFGIDAGAPIAEGEGPGQLPPARRNPVVQDPAQRFNEPAPAGTPVVAGDGSIPGVNLVDTPDDIAEFVNPDAKQADFAAWGLRAPEIARAGRERADVKKLVDLIDKEKAASELASNAATAEERDRAKAERQTYDAQIKKLIGDSFGIRPGVKFGRNNYSITDGASIRYSITDLGEVTFSIEFAIQDERGRRVGEGSRSVRGLSDTDVLGNVTRKWVVTNNLLKIYNKNDQKFGFASAYNRYMEDWYIANGFSSINVFAAGGNSWSGGFVWAVNGFNWKGSQASTVPSILRSMLRRSETSDEEVAIIQRMLDRIAKDNPTGNYTPDTVPTPLEIALIGWYPGAETWLGKKQMKSMGWYGEKRLDPQAIEQRQAINYEQSRNAKKRIKDKANRAGISRDLVLKMNSNEFAAANPELAPYLDQIRDVLRNNRSLAVLSPAAKTALNRFTASQLLKGEDRTATLQDIFKLRTALDAEFKADNPLAGSKDFGVGNQLLDVSIDDVSANRVPGFTVRRLGMYESGVNETFMLTHNDSGQVFFVKKDSYATQYQINGAGAEVQADAMLRASGVVAGYEARVSNVDDEIIVMQRAGAGVPLLGEPMTASNAIGNKLSINLPDGTTVKVTADNFMDLLHTPEDAVRVMLVDLIISNMDRHNGNLLLAVDGTDTGKIRLLPIDHALSSFSPDTEGMQYTVSELFDNSFDNLYGMAMPVLTTRLKQEELLDLFKNEARVMMEELNNPANLPTGKELDLIIKNFGSLDAYREKIQQRIDSLLVPGNEAHEAFLNVLKPGYWSTR